MIQGSTSGHSMEKKSVGSRSGLADVSAELQVKSIFYLKIMWKISGLSELQKWQNTCIYIYISIYISVCIYIYVYLSQFG